MCTQVSVHGFKVSVYNKEATLKKSLFPVQRVAEIMVTRAAENSFFFPPLFFLVRKVLKCFEGKI